MGKKVKESVLDQSASGTSGFTISSRKTVPAVWSLRILCRLKGIKRMRGYPRSITSDGVVLHAIGLGKLEDKNIALAKFKKILKDKLDNYEERELLISGNLNNNLNKLGDLLSLNEVDKQILAFAVVIYSHEGLDEVADTLGSLVSDRAIYALSIILEVPEQAVQEALSVTSVLSRTGLLRIDRSDVCFLKSKLELQSGFANVMQESHADVMSLLKNYFRESNGSMLKAADFEYLGVEYTIARDLVKQARKCNAKGVNILLYGPPGTGKTELARLLTNQPGMCGYEVSCDESDVDTAHTQDRFMAYQLSQSVLEHQKKAMLIFDEIEDVFAADTGPFFGRMSSNRPRKAWTNRILEENPVPAIWISNDIECMDKAYLRRFDFALKLDVPPRDVRERILKKHLNRVEISNTWIRNISSDVRITPAIASSAARVVSMIGKGGQAEKEQVLDHILSNSLQALGYETTVKKESTGSLAYCVEALNPDRDISPILSGLERGQHARICLYGPPGTGKTAFGKYMAERIDKPLIVKRASDLLSRYVGDVEQNIAAMFKEANRERAILMLDEADSFLRDRKGAKNSWEVTQVNELLTQMESFDGVFICSTNLIDSLDEASIRRFDFKIKLNYLHHSQAWLLFCQAIKDSGGSSPRGRNGWREKLKRFENLTPGDFALVMRQNRLVAEPLASDVLYEALKKESVFKKGGDQKGGIGFTAAL